MAQFQGSSEEVVNLLHHAIQNTLTAKLITELHKVMDVQIRVFAEESVKDCIKGLTAYKAIDKDKIELHITFGDKI